MRAHSQLRACLRTINMGSISAAAQQRINGGNVQIKYLVTFIQLYSKMHHSQDNTQSNRNDKASQGIMEHFFTLKLRDPETGEVIVAFFLKPKFFCNSQIFIEKSSCKGTEKRKTYLALMNSLNDMTPASDRP